MFRSLIGFGTKYKANNRCKANSSSNTQFCIMCSNSEFVSILPLVLHNFCILRHVSLCRHKLNFLPLKAMTALLDKCGRRCSQSIEEAFWKNKFLCLTLKNSLFNSHFNFFKDEHCWSAFYQCHYETFYKFYIMVHFDNTAFFY